MSGGFQLELPAEALEAIAQRAAAIVRADLERASGGDRWMTVEQAAAYIAAKPQRVYDLHSQGRLRGHKDGRRLLFRQSELDAYLQAAG